MQHETTGADEPVRSIGATGYTLSSREDYLQRLLTEKQAAEFLGLSVRTLQGWRVRWSPFRPAWASDHPLPKAGADRVGRSARHLEHLGSASVQADEPACHAALCLVALKENTMTREYTHGRAAMTVDNATQSTAHRTVDRLQHRKVTELTNCEVLQSGNCKMPQPPNCEMSPSQNCEIVDPALAQLSPSHAADDIRCGICGSCRDGLTVAAEDWPDRPIDQIVGLVGLARTGAQVHSKPYQNQQSIEPHIATDRGQEPEMQGPHLYRHFMSWDAEPVRLFRKKRSKGKRSSRQSCRSKQWLPVGKTHRPKPKFSGPKPAIAIQTREKPISSGFDRLPLLEKRQRWAEAWISSGLPQPNVMISLKYRSDDVRGARDCNQTLAELVYADREAIRNALKEHSIRQLPNMWVIETRNGFGAHLIAHLPPNDLIRRTVALVLCRRRGVVIRRPKKVLELVWRPNSGRAVHCLDIDPTVRYEGTGRSGFLGLIDYTSKELHRNRLRRDAGLIGKLAGCSSDISRLAQERYIWEMMGRDPSGRVAA